MKQQKEKYEQEIEKKKQELLNESAKRKIEEKVLSVEQESRKL